MRRNFSLAILFIASLYILSAQAFSQVRRHEPTIRVNERIQQTIVRNSRVDLAQWLRVSRADVRHTEIKSLTISAQSFRTGELEITFRGRLIARMQLRRQPVTKTFELPQNAFVGDIAIKVTSGEVFVERVGAILKELRFEPAPRPTPPRHEPAPRPIPPRQVPVPRPAPRR